MIEASEARLLSFGITVEALLEDVERRVRGTAMAGRRSIMLVEKDCRGMDRWIAGNDSNPILEETLVALRAAGFTVTKVAADGRDYRDNTAAHLRISW